jgi:endonuclease/exonuclease/phosphatase family metal-dependent hydrolase
VTVKKTLVYALTLLVAVTLGCSTGPDERQSSDASAQDDADAADAGETADVPTSLRVATYNASLYRQNRGQLQSDLEGGDDPQAQKVAAILQTVRPDVVLINEFDWDDEGASARIFVEQYLAVAQGGVEGLDYPYRYVPETNTGVHSGADLNKDGRIATEPGSRAYGNDAFGFGQFPGQYGMVVYSKYPILEDEVRSFRLLKWSQMPENLLPTDWYTEAAVDALRLSSKNHVDIPIEVDGRTLHVLASHPTPPSFDGEEDRNGRRNHDEIRFWSDYIGAGDAGYIRDDSGVPGGLSDDAAFVIAGDLNSDPRDGDSRHGGIRGLLEHPRTQDTEPGSEGAVSAAASDGGANESHEGAPRLDTADFSDGRVGNLRVDYVLPSANVEVTDSGVFWPEEGQDGAELLDASDHRLVWVDILL